MPIRSIVFVTLVGFSFASGEGNPTATPALSATATPTPTLTPTPPVAHKITFRVELATRQREFHIGERIPLKLSFSSDVKQQYWLDMATYDRSGRMEHEHFTITPSDGAVDPLQDDSYTVKIMGGLTNFQFLTRKPWTIELNLNEWLRFTRPGEYKLQVTSERVSWRDKGTPLRAHSDPPEPSATSPVTAVSNELTLKIIPADPAWQQRVLKQAAAILRLPVRPTPVPKIGVGYRVDAEVEKLKKDQYEALEILSFLATADAVREMINHLRPSTNGGIDVAYVRGVISSPDRASAGATLEQALFDPDRAIDSGFLYLLSLVIPPPITSYDDLSRNRKNALEMLVNAIPAKRGDALPVSLSTAVDEAWGTPVAHVICDRFCDELFSVFDQLPISDRTRLLTYRWDKIKSAALLPILMKYAQDNRDFSNLDVNEGYELPELTLAALTHWFELDPDGARPVIIKEITRPQPRYGGRALGFLPDEMLPRVDEPLAEHFISSENAENAARIASLIARYASPAILPRILAELDKHLWDWSCDIQNSILAYVLRVKPELAKPRIEKAIIAARKKKNRWKCDENVLTGIAVIRYDPLLNEIAIRMLDNRDPIVAIHAAQMLGKYGSPAAEPELWKRFESWSKRCVGHESELNRAWLAGSEEVDVYRLGVGNALLEALATGQAWLADPAMFQRLKQMNKLSFVQESVNRYLSHWDKGPLYVSIVGGSDFRAFVAQYEYIESFDRLKAKLAEFPTGTQFVISNWGGEEAVARNEAELCDFLNDRGIELLVETSAQ